MNDNYICVWNQDARWQDESQAVRQRVLDDPGYLASQDKYGDTPLLRAICFGDLALVEFLLGQGADPNACNQGGYTALLTAIESEEEESPLILTALIKAGADLQQTGANGLAPLHMAAAQGRVDKAELLIQAGADINQRTPIDAADTPLMVAACIGRPGTVQLLLRYGADPSLRNLRDQTALDIAKSMSAGPNPELFDLLQSIQIDYDAALDELNEYMKLPPQELARMKAEMKKVDPAAEYLEDCQKCAGATHYLEVIRLLNPGSSTEPLVT